jgi:paired amphipathic helix protein Sin3a
MYVDADDEGEVSAQKSSEDSDLSSSEQSGGEQSEHEEDEEELDEKVESEGEAEGMDADDGDEDGNFLLTTPESSYAHCKPLSVYTASASALVDGHFSKRVERIFYGNDMLYVLIRLDLSACSFPSQLSEVIVTLH